MGQALGRGELRHSISVYGKWAISVNGVAGSHFFVVRSPLSMPSGKILFYA
jgi:hypothetical protein